MALSAVAGGLVLAVAAVVVDPLLRPGPSGDAVHPLIPGSAPEAAASAGSSADAEAAPGIVRANVPNFRLIVSSIDGIDEIRGLDGRAEAPPGSYTLMRWSAEVRDAKGRRWQAKGGMQPELLEVRSGQETRVRLADPIRVVMRGFYQQNPVSFRLEFSGSEGEMFEGVTVDGEPAPLPRLQIRDAKGKLVFNQRFKPGCKGTCLLSWKVPPGTKGRFIATAIPDFGPFRAEVASPLDFTIDGARAAANPPRVGSVAPNFRLLTTDTGQVQLALLRGEPVVLAFFCRCGLCHAVAKEMASKPELSRKAKVFAVFGDQTIGKPAEEKAFREATGFRAPFLLDFSYEA
ncbi:MAG: peroxiredoxin family protein, partial [Chloroflexi bacterium]|nr:peroxiredoxin family protein [Chloroflexota bacterium]